MEATTPELGPVGFWSPNPVPSALAPPFSRRSCKKLSKSTAEYKTVGRSELEREHDIADYLTQHDKEEKPAGMFVSA